MVSTTSVQTLISQFELMIQATAVPKAPSTWPVTKKTVSALSRKTVVKKESIAGAKPAKTKFADFKCLTIATLKSQDENDAELTTKLNTMCYLHMPRSPSAYSTTSTASMDSLLSSREMSASDLQHSSGEVSTNSPKVVKSTTKQSKVYSLANSPQSTKLVSRTSCQRGILNQKPLSAKMEKSSRLAPVPTNARRSSLSSDKATSISTRTNPPRSTYNHAESRRTSMPTSRYMNYDSSPRFAATKTMNLERRRKLEKRKRNIAVDPVEYLGSRTAR